MGKGSTSLRFLSWIRIVVPIFSYGSPTPIFPIISLAVASRSEISYTDGAQHRHGIVVCGIGLGFCGDYENGNRCRDAQKRHFYAHAGHCDDVVRHVVSIVINFSNRWVRALLGVRAQNRMQQVMFHRLLSRNWMNIRHYHSGDVLNRLFKDVGTLVGLLTDDIPGLITTIVQFIGAFCFLCTMDSRLAWVIVGILPLTLIISKLYMKRLRSLTHQVRAEESKVQSAIQEAVQHSLVIKTLDSLDYVVERLANTQQHLHSKVIEKTKYSSFSATFVNLGFAAGYLVTFAWGVFELQRDAITYGVLLAFIQLVGQIQGPLRSLSSYVPTFINAATACERLMELEQMPADRAAMKRAFASPQSTTEVGEKKRVESLRRD